MTDQQHHDDEAERQRAALEKVFQEEAEEIEDQYFLMIERREAEQEAEAIRREFMSGLRTSKTRAVYLIEREQGAEAAAEAERLIFGKFRDIETTGAAPSTDFEREVLEIWGREAMTEIVTDYAETARRIDPKDMHTPLEAKELKAVSERVAEREATRLADLEDFRASGAWMKPGKTIPPTPAHTPEEQETDKHRAAGMVYDLYAYQQKQQRYEREKASQEKARKEEAAKAERAARIARLFAPKKDTTEPAPAPTPESRSIGIWYEFTRALEGSTARTITALAMDGTDPARLAEMGRILDQWNHDDLECNPLNIEPKNDLEKTLAEAWGREAMRAAVADCAEHYREGPFYTCEPLEAKELPDLAQTLADKHARYLADLEEYRASGAWMTPYKTIPYKERTPEELETAREGAARAVYDLYDDQERRRNFQERAKEAAPERKEADPGQKRREMIERTIQQTMERLREPPPLEKSKDRSRER